jgi:hypothetical protein
MRDRLIKPALRGQNHCEVIVRFRIAGRAPQDSLIQGNRAAAKPRGMETERFLEDSLRAGTALGPRPPAVARRYRMNNRQLFRWGTAAPVSNRHRAV